MNWQIEFNLENVKEIVAVADSVLHVLIVVRWSCHWCEACLVSGRTRPRSLSGCWEQIPECEQVLEGGDKGRQGSVQMDLPTKVFFFLTNGLSSSQGFKYCETQPCSCVGGSEEVDIVQQVEHLLHVGLCPVKVIPQSMLQQEMYSFKMGTITNNLSER